MLRYSVRLGQKKPMILLLLIASFMGCRNEISSGTSNASNPDTSTAKGQASPPAGTTAVYTSSDFFINMQPATASSSFAPIYNLHVWNDWTKPCKVALTDTGAATDILCILEIAEYDMFYLGSVLAAGGYDDRFYLTYNVPAAFSCPNFEYIPFYYWRYNPGIGPSAVTENVDNAAGTILFSDSGDGKGTPDPATPGATFPIVQADGTCSYDYRGSGGPNCCFGKYNLTIRTKDATGAISATHSIADWGGDLSTCISGPATDPDTWGARVSKSGYIYDKFPDYVRVNMDIEPRPFNKSIALNGGRARNFLTNAFSTNYFDVPGPATQAKYITSGNWPRAIKGPGTAGGFTFASGQPFYEARCKDKFGDVLSRIRVLVRPWSTSSQFVAQASTHWQDAGPEGIPYTDQDYLDRPGWADTSATFGATFNFLTYYPAGSN